MSENQYRSRQVSARFSRRMIMYSGFKSRLRHQDQFQRSPQNALDLAAPNAGGFLTAGKSRADPFEPARGNRVQPPAHGCFDDLPAEALHVEVRNTGHAKGLGGIDKVGLL
jgi:hypothetical protein